jgi:predicted house-cleaning noncanonical NTP pyrophosphatase (MazG superfamily)|tara:strand:+ start:599 stop:1015 length:417 start_codon:yes stop_codon:yes gene_type:complete
MKETLDGRIDEILEITSLVPTSELKPEVSARVKPKTDGKDDDIDYNYARENYYNLIERNQDAIEEMLEIAKQSEHPRAFEVVGQLIKSGLDANKELMTLHKTKKELSIEKGGAGVAVNNAVFVGSTADLQKLLKANRG